MTTENTTEKTETPEISSNKAVFGPLGKYAAVAVIMVSLIVTTAIMLDRQLQSVDEQIATIEEEVASIHAAETSTHEVITAVTTTAAAADTEISEAQVADDVTDKTVAATETYVEIPAAKTAVTETVATSVAEAPVTQEVIATTETTATTTPAAQFEMAAIENNAAQAHQAQRVKANQARINAYKQEQKKHMSEMFARINTLESQQLDRYKANQDSRIVRLREQIAQQQQMIEALVLRSKKLFELRAASMQRSQDNREQALNRI